MQKLTQGGGKLRASNIELLRIVAIFMVLYVHADYLSLGWPKAEQLAANPFDTSMSVLGQAFCCVCVNAFVMISGWFGIKPKVRSLAAFIFQCFFIALLVYAACLASGSARLSISGIRDCLMLGTWDWFSKSYLLLYILAPALNLLVEHSSRQQLRWTLIAFFSIQTVIDWMLHTVPYFDLGYSPLSFAGLYLLARYAKVYRPRWASLSARTDVGIYVALAVLNAVTTIAVGLASGVMLGRSLVYTSPFVIAGAMFLLLAFSKLHIQSKFINWAAASSFTIYLIHQHPCISVPFYYPAGKWLHEQLGTSYFLLLIPILAAVFMTCVLADQLRIAVWRRIGGPVERGVSRAMQRL